MLLILLSQEKFEEMIILRKKLFRRILQGTGKMICLALFIVFVLIPIIFRYSYSLQRNMLFLPFVRWPRNVDFNHPEKLGLMGTRNFYVKSPKGVKLGAWHILPKSLLNDSENAEDVEKYFEESLTHGEPVILYMHGNSGSRAGLHRIELYHVLQNLNYHIISFDYRSYADSSPIPPSEEGVVEDGVFIYNWLKEKVKNAPLFVWGHSLGTGISSHVLDHLATGPSHVKEEVDGLGDHEKKSSSALPLGLVLEAPFSNLRDEIREHPLAQLFRWMPWFDHFFLNPVNANNLAFETDKHLKNVNIPIIILHAEDDAVVPFKLGLKLYSSTRNARSEMDAPIDFIKFEEQHHFGHKYICRSPALPNIISEFVNNTLEKKKA
ncbi:hypothetical protein J437_LFUL011856 [Ladona fulva]|uniref:AB hydrolase-1 domain-containing protein n=1 Tax=Ladona fulva TaxID=123851 RepID=A0A8K0P633_LADFU|nr:hypothetical protein J437_LFUL011856 [Ladona fulva]